MNEDIISQQQNLKVKTTTGKGMKIIKQNKMESHTTSPTIKITKRMYLTTKTQKEDRCTIKREYMWKTPQQDLNTPIPSTVATVTRMKMNIMTKSQNLNPL